jgi:hypothetical protein
MQLCLSASLIFWHRKTGIMLQDTGVRDEHGMEPLDGIFSSPEKPPPKRSSGYKTGGTVITSESMEVQESTSGLQKRRVGAPPGLSGFERVC